MKTRSETELTMKTSLLGCAAIPLCWAVMSSSFHHWSLSGHRWSVPVAVCGLCKWKPQRTCADRRQDDGDVTTDSDDKSSSLMRASSFIRLAAAAAAAPEPQCGSTHRLVWQRRRWRQRWITTSSIDFTRRTQRRIRQLLSMATAAEAT